ncbi:hypothetical protein Fcan01_00746 [Folsomia candida]|uniref:F-box domain-containing protein n=2 Tax=Folsomia candida TaxID=158441 RepID=A0A226EYL5_FOLCA|nr:hypothetical protein Fcan01_00746 [Folsomia candida]
MDNFDGELLSRTFRGVPYCFCFKCCMFAGMPRKLPSFIRQVGGKLWKPFAILSNIEGQKVTIGETFTNGEEQGEFIFWKRPMKDQLKITTGGNLPICEITCAENKYWITPLLSRGEVVAVNDVEIQDRTELKFGDYLSLGVPATPEELGKWKKSHDNFIPFPSTDNEDDLPGWAKFALDAFESTHRLVLLFQRREYDFDLFWKKELEEKRIKTSKSEGDDDLNLEHVEKTEAGFTPQLDELVVPHILSYLPFDDLKNVRFVSKVWNREALRLIRKKSYVKFDFLLGYKKLDDPTKLFRYNHEMQDNPIPCWQIAIPSIGLEDYLHEVRPDQGEKIIADFHWFLGLKTHSVTWLRLAGKIASKFDYNTQIKILGMCPTQTIQHFELNWDWSTIKASGRGYRFPSSIKFTNLETFVLSMNVGHYDVQGDGGPSHDCSSLTWLAPLISAVQGVRVLILDTSSPLLETFYNQATPFQNLDEITIQENLTPEGLKFLNKLQQPLTKMNLGRLEHWKKPQYLGFGRLLQNHSQTLTSLKITLGNCVKSNTILSLPIFPSLKKLHVDMDSMGEQYEEEKFPIDVSFDGDNDISYAKHFPSLKSLEFGYNDGGFLMRRNENANDYLFDVFLPLGHGEDGDAGFQVCKTLRHLDLPTKAISESGQLFDRLGEIARMFPNVHNPWINKTRESSENQTEQVSSD